MQGGVLGAIELLGYINNGKTDKETHVDINQIIKAIKTKDRQAWPSKDLRKLYNSMDKFQQKLFYDVMKDMKEGLDEAYGRIDV